MNNTAKALLMAGLAGVVGLAVGYALATASAPERAFPPPPTCPVCPDCPDPVAANGPHPGARTFSRDPGPEDARQEDQAAMARLEAKAALQAKLIEGMQAEKTGEPVPWQPGIPAVYRPDEFGHIVSQALDEVESPLEIIQAECSEPPCISVLRGIPQGDPAWKDLNRQLHDVAVSRSWRDAYGDEFSMAAMKSVDCGDGRTEWVVMMAPSIDALEGEPVADNLTRRLTTRMQQILSGIVCKPAVY